MRALTVDEIASTEFSRLLWLAAEVGEAELERIARDELPTLVVLGVVDHERVVAFVAFDPGTDPVTIEYIAVSESRRDRGCGAELVDAVRARANGRAIRAQTDDDAVDFYRRIGFEIRACEPDPRWPSRQRYDCVRAEDRRRVAREA